MYSIRGVRINIVEYSRVEWKGGNNPWFSLRMKNLNENAKRKAPPWDLSGLHFYRFHDQREEKKSKSKNRLPRVKVLRMKIP